MLMGSKEDGGYGGLVFKGLRWLCEEEDVGGWRLRIWWWNVVKLLGFKMRKGEWRIMKVVPKWLNSSPFEVRKLALYKEDEMKNLKSGWKPNIRMRF